VRRQQASFRQPQVGGASPPPQFENVDAVRRFPLDEYFYADPDYFFARPPRLRRGNADAGGTLISRRPHGLELGSNVVIRTYQAAHGGLVFDSALTRRQKLRRNRLTALAVIAVVAASAGLLQHFQDNAASGAPASSDAGIYFAAR
jgi:hypothetical protein